MALENLLKVETVVLVVTVAMFVVVIIKMKPLKDFSNIKIGKGGVELNRSDEYKKLLDFAEEFTKRLDKLSAESSGDIKGIRERLNKIDGRLDDHYKYIRRAVTFSGMSVGWSGASGIPFEEVVDALLMNISLGENGNHEERLKNVIKGGGDNGRRDYYNKLNKFIAENKGRLDAQFYEVMERVRKYLA